MMILIILSLLFYFAITQAIKDDCQKTTMGDVSNAEGCPMMKLGTGTFIHKLTYVEVPP